ncbi:MAG: hypothetical protein GY694_16790 [Gammaproteobacteria bacterium]|nr:hypothetical protein [Gammaproteobacteria bacterium]
MQLKDRLKSSLEDVREHGVMSLQLGCDMGISKPLSADKVLNWTKTWILVALIRNTMEHY